MVPPKGWRARRQPFPDLRKVKIHVPIRQHVFGTKGAYRCVFMEGKEVSVAEFKLTAGAWGGAWGYQRALALHVNT